MAERKYVIVYSYSGEFESTNSVGVVADNYGEVDRNLKAIFDDVVEMTPRERDDILENEWYFIMTLDDEEWNIVKNLKHYKEAE